MPRVRRSYTISNAALGKFVLCLDSDGARAQEKYDGLHRRLMAFFEYNGCHDPASAVDRTIDRAIRKIGEGANVPNVAAFAYGIARNVLKEFRKIAPPEVELHDMGNVSDVIVADVDTEVQCLDMCLGKLEKQNRTLIIDYYGVKDRRSLREKYGISSEALRNRAFHIRNRLRDCLEACLQERRTPELIHVSV